MWWTERMARFRLTDSVAAARRAVVRIAILYVLLVGIWVLIQSGIPIAFFIEAPLPRATWLQVLNGWFFVISAGWLLYLLVARTLDTIARAQAELRLRDRAIESSVNGIMMIDYLSPERPIVYANPAFERITGYASAEAIGRGLKFLYAGQEDRPEYAALSAALKEQRDCRVVLRSFRKNGDIYWSEMHLAPVRDLSGRVTHYVGIQNDVTEARRYEEELARHANFDTLTGLPNRNLLLDRIEGAILRAERYSQMVALAFVDLDNFKRVNDSLGHKGGDELLKLVAERLSSHLRAVDTVARLGGDDFALVLVDHLGERLVSTQMQRIFDVLANPFLVDGRELFLTASIGVALFSQDGKDAEGLLKNAEVAMYRAKEQGGNAFQLFAPEMNALVSERLALEARLHRAVDRGELLLHYQPKLDLRTNRVIGTEALVRWHQPELGLVSPAKFIPLAEETGLIVSIGEWVMRTACAQNKAWQDAGLEPITVSVNVSAKQFRQKQLVERVAEILKDTGLPPRYLEIELTESALMHDVEEAIGTLARLKGMGVQISVDDFGTGYSSLNYLKRFPVDRLKIDQSFVRDLSTDPDDAAIVVAVIQLGHSLKLRVIAEGVETLEQLAFLREHQSDEKQGYLFSKPLTAEALEQLLRSGHALAQ